MSPVKAPANLPDLVKAAFARAKANVDLTYFPTQVTLISSGSIPFQLRFSPALASKPTAPKPKPSGKPFNPFESPEKGPLFIADIAPAHNLVLNKFAVVPEHFILATKQYKEQTHLLEEADLAATYACIEAYYDSHNSAGELFAFFNSGPHSGASQPHRHIQLLPVEQMKDGLTEPTDWNVLADELSSASDVPFATFSRPIAGTTATERHRAYLALFGEALEATKAFAAQHPERDDIFTATGDGAAPISYNMAMTRSTLVICPRIAEGAAISTHGGQTAGKLSLNGTVLAGTALVKSESEWDALRADEAEGATTLATILSKIGIPNSAGGSHQL